MKATDLNLAELLDFAHGKVCLDGQRLIIHELNSLGEFRRDLIEMTGYEKAQRILTRKGLFWGHADAAAMGRLFEWDSPSEWLKAGAMMNRIHGLAETEINIRVFEPQNGRFEFEAVWKNSSEVEQHRQIAEHKAHPICWALVGYASGYASHCTGKNIVFMETQCQAAGAPCCVAIGKDIESWGNEIEPHLRFFQATDIREKVNEMADRLQQRHDLARQHRAKESAVPQFAKVEVRSPVFKQTVELAARVAKFDTTVLITGETGSGKEVLAQYIHQCSLRVHKPMLAINCSALPETLLESELFGHRAGAFTGASRSHTGLFEEADGGTLFLDEIGDITPAMQAKLLRVLQEREVKPVGETASRPVDVRVISATNQNLERLVAEGKFREDLFFRLHVVHIRVPPLRERREDILPLARHFLKRCVRRHRLPELRLAPACVDVLLKHAWPGNVRELDNAIEHAAVMCNDRIITPELLPLASNPRAGGAVIATAYRSLEEVELDHIRHVLQLAGGNRTEAAQILKIGEATLYRKLKQLKTLML